MSWTARTPHRRSEWPPKYLEDKRSAITRDGRDNSGKEKERQNVLCPRMHNDIRTMRKRVLQPRRSKRRIDKQQCPPTMCLFRIVPDIVGSSKGIDGCFEVDDIALSQLFGGTVEGQDLNACETRMDGKDRMRTVVSSADGDFSWFKPCLRGLLRQCRVRGEKQGDSHRLRRWHLDPNCR